MPAERHRAEASAIGMTCRHGDGIIMVHRMVKPAAHSPLTGNNACRQTSCRRYRGTSARREAALHSFSVERARGHYNYFDDIGMLSRRIIIERRAVIDDIN